MSSSLPGGRVKLLASALITLLLVGSPVPVLTVFGLMHGAAPAPLGPHATHRITAAQQMTILHHGLMQTFWITYSTTVLLAFWLYVALWFITSRRSPVGYLQGLIVIAAVILMPTRRILEPDGLVAWDHDPVSGTLSTFGALFSPGPGYDWRRESCNPDHWPASGTEAIPHTRSRDRSAAWHRQSLAARRRTAGTGTAGGAHRITIPRPCGSSI